jgi:Protein of unknown function (DUF4239)
MVGQQGKNGEDVPDFVYDIPREQLAAYFSLGAVVIVLLGLVFLKPVLRLFVRGDASTNETITLTTSAFSLFYGLLLGLLTVAAYENRDRVQTAILNEASAIGAIYGTVASYPEPYRTDLRELLRDYVQYTIYRDWPAHRDGDILQGGTNRVNAFGQWLARFEPTSASQEILHQASVTSFEVLKQARQMRLNGVSTRIPSVLWYAVAVGAAVNILVLLMIRARAVPHFVLGTISAFFLGVIIFVILALDAPLRGPEGLSPAPYQALWSQQMAWDEPHS